MTDKDIQAYIVLMMPNIQAYNLVDGMPNALPMVCYPRIPGAFPPPEEKR